MSNAVLNERVRKVWKLIVATEAVTQALAMIPVSPERERFVTTVPLTIMS
jgi:hypothetical protein